MSKELARFRLFRRTIIVEYAKRDDDFIVPAPTPSASIPAPLLVAPVLMMDDTDATKVCPYCAETIKAAAIVCRFCNRDLVAPVMPASTVTQPKYKPGSPLGFILVTILFCGGGWWLLNGLTDSTRRATPHKVHYAVIGSQSADLTYQNASGASEQATEPLPWYLDFTAAPGTFLYVAAQTTKDGTARCVITVDGEQLQVAEVTGDYHIATCSGSVPK